MGRRRKSYTREFKKRPSGSTAPEPTRGFLVGPHADESARAAFALRVIVEVEAVLAEHGAAHDAQAERKVTTEAAAHVLAPTLALIIGATKGLQKDLGRLDETMSANRSARVKAYVKRLG